MTRATPEQLEAAHAMREAADDCERALEAAMLLRTDKAIDELRAARDRVAAAIARVKELIE
jgi:hypothetical protein